MTGLCGCAWRVLLNLQLPLCVRKTDELVAMLNLSRRFNIATALVEELSLPDAAATAAAVDAARRAALSHADPSTSAHAPDLAAACAAEAALAVYAVWLRLTAARLLEWNHNYNVKPREISAAQTRLTAGLTQMWLSHPWTRGLVAVALSAVGRGGDGDMGQRIRDEILAIQSKNGTKGGMMEQWHQKLHNNTSPDDVVICAALLAYIDACAPLPPLSLCRACAESGARVSFETVGPACARSAQRRRRALKGGPLRAQGPGRFCVLGDAARGGHRRGAPRVVRPQHHARARLLAKPGRGPARGPVGIHGHAHRRARRPRFTGGAFGRRGVLAGALRSVVPAHIADDTDAVSDVCDGMSVLRDASRTRATRANL